MPTKTKLVKKTPELFVSTSLTSDDADKILLILNQKNANKSKKDVIVSDLETQLTGGRNHLQNSEAWPDHANIRENLDDFLKSAEKFEVILNQTVNNIHLRCALRNQGRRNVIDYIYMGDRKVSDRKGIHEDFLELIYQAEQAVKETQKKGRPGQKNARLAAARRRVQKDLEAKVYEKYYQADGKPDRNKANREDFWKICKAYIEPKA